MKKIQVSAAKAVAEEHDLRQCLLIGYDGDRVHIVTYGRTKADCEQAAKAQDFWQGHIREFSFDARKEVEHLRERLRIEKARFESAIRLISAITLFMKPNNIHTPDGKTYEYNPSDEIVRMSWDGLTKAIRTAQEFHQQQQVQVTAHPMPDDYIGVWNGSDEKESAK